VTVCHPERVWNDKLPDGRDPRPVYWIVMGLVAILGGLAWWAIILNGRVGVSPRGLEFVLIPIGLGAVIYGAVLHARARRRR
jgi:hypothetical protein